MSSLAGVLGRDPGVDADAVASEMAQHSIRYPGQSHRGLSCSSSSRRFSAYVIERAADRVLEAQVLDGSACELDRWLIGDPNYQRYGSASGEAGRPGGWVELEWDDAAAALTLRTDSGGLLCLYLAVAPDRIVFGTDFAALLSALPSRPAINRPSLVTELVLGYVPDDSTILQGISVAPPGATLRLDVAGVHVQSVATAEYGDQFVGWNKAQKYRKLDEIYDSIAERIIAACGDSLVLSMSAGYDSRMAIAILERNGLVPPLCTYGYTEGQEVYGARSMAAKVGATTEVYSIEHSDWDDWQKRVQGGGGFGMLLFAGWLQNWMNFQRRFGRHTLLGYIGDALSGKRLGAEVLSLSSEPVTAWTRWCFDNQGWLDSPLLTPEARALAIRSVPDYSEALAARADYAFDYQRLLHQDLGGRQRRRVAQQPNAIRPMLSPVLFLCQPELIHFFSNVALADLAGQRLYLAYAEDRFPHLFGEHPRSPHLLVGRIQTKAARVRDRLLGRTMVDRSRPVIDNRGIIRQHAEPIEALSGRVRHLIEPCIDVPLFIHVVRSLAQRSEYRLPVQIGHLVQCVNLFMLLDLLND